MRFIEEIVVEEFLPTYRSMLAERLREKGLTQSEVADLLGISQSAVSKYSTGEVERNETLLADERLQELTDDLATGMAKDTMSTVQALAETEVFIRQLENEDMLAQLHERAYPPLADFDGNLPIHDPESRVRQSERVRSSIRRGLNKLENTSGFARLIPAVGSNLVECLPDPTGIDDVIGVPGRILEIKGRAEIPGDPEFGVSQHVASVLLTAREYGHDGRAALNIAYSPDIIRALQDSERTTEEFDGEMDIEDALRDIDVTGVDVLYQTGGFGVEPIVYLLGPDAPTVSDHVRDIADQV